MFGFSFVIFKIQITTGVKKVYILVWKTRLFAKVQIIKAVDPKGKKNERKRKQKQKKKECWKKSRNKNMKISVYSERRWEKLRKTELAMWSEEAWCGVFGYDEVEE